MSVTDLLSRIPFSPVRARSPEARPPEAEPRRTFAVEVPGPERPARDVDPSFVARKRAPAPEPPPAPGVPSWAVLLIGGLVVVCVALATALAALAVGGAPGPAPAPEAAAEAPAPAPVFSAAPIPIPVDVLTGLEAVGQEPIEVELGHLLAAIGHGFGDRSARLEPTLQSYVYRMASRFEWSPDSFRVAVTAPDAALADARGDLLERLFEPAVAAGRLRVGTGVGPHALTLVSPTHE